MQTRIAPTYAEISKLALPIMVSGISIHLIGLIDTMFLGRLSEAELGAAGNGTLFHYTVVLSIAGLCSGAQIIMARRNGEGALAEIGSLFGHILWLALALGSVCWLFLFAASGPLVNALYQSPTVARHTADFMAYRSFGTFPALINFCFIAFFVATTKTRALAIGPPLMAVTNIGLDYLLIFGIGPFPELGVRGAAIASVMAECVGTLFFLWYARRFAVFKPYQLRFRPSLAVEPIRRIVAVGLPLVAQQFLAMAGWFVFFALVEGMGERPLAVSHIVRAVYLIIGIPLVAWADASNTLVGNLIGSDERHLVAPTMKRIAILLLGVAGGYIVFLNWWTYEVVSAFTTIEALRDATVPALRVISFSNVLFALGMLAYRSLAAYGQTAACLRIEISALLVYLALTWWLVSSRAPIEVVWCTEFIYFGVLGGLSLMRLVRTDGLVKAV